MCNKVTPFGKYCNRLPISLLCSPDGFKKIMEDTCARYGGEEINACFSDDWKQYLETLDRVFED